ncbi:MAG: vanadium-dependent haloperoxidase [Pirellulaceae bacterium]|nr:vanadium-dependent haloperoxidase [Pirellulaceae bacterium]
MLRRKKNSLITLSLCLMSFYYWPGEADGQSVARQWNQALLDAIRIDFPAPTVHSRNLYHTSSAMYDAWATYDHVAQGHFFTEKHNSPDPQSAREESISFAAYRVLSHRYALALEPTTSQQHFANLMTRLGFDPSNTSTIGNSPSAIGNRIAAIVIQKTINDGCNETDPINAYRDNTGYVQSSTAMLVDYPSVYDGNLNEIDPNRWQPLLVDSLVSHNGGPLEARLQEYIGPHWGQVATFALGREHPTGTNRWSTIDPGPPPQFGGDDHQTYVDNVLELIRYSRSLDPNQGPGAKPINTSPAVNGNRPLGTNTGVGHAVNPTTGKPYPANYVKTADYGRVLAEFWADGPGSETPPGHWNVIANDVSDHPSLVKRIGGSGPVVDDLEWDTKLYFTLNGGTHDAAVAAWGTKRQYDYARPITMIRYLAALGQSTDPSLPSYHPDGLPLETGLVEMITADSIAPGGRHHNAFINANLTSDGVVQNFVSLDQIVGKLAINAWNHKPTSLENGNSGTDWILAENWVPYQNDDFVTPAFASYVSGHSTFSRAAAEVLTRFTGDAYFPDGLAEATFTPEFLDFEAGPSEPVTLQWATYYDAADEAGISRLWGGIHVPEDDFAGRIMGQVIGNDSFNLALQHFHGVPEPSSYLLLLSSLLFALKIKRNGGRNLRILDQLLRLAAPRH